MLDVGFIGKWVGKKRGELLVESMMLTLVGYRGWIELRGVYF